MQASKREVNKNLQKEIFQILYKLLVDLKNQEVKRANEEDYCYRVAWRDIRDWVLAQMALYETAMVEMPQIFLPFATDSQGQTIYDKVLKGQFLLGSGEN
mgnify:CR=1 FL=1